MSTGRLYSPSTLAGRRTVTQRLECLCGFLKQKGNQEFVTGLRPNQITLRIVAPPERASHGPGYIGESPRLGMLKDLEELGVLLIGEYLEHGGRAGGALHDTPGPEQSI